MENILFKRSVLFFRVSIRLELHNHFWTFATLAETVFSKLRCEASWINKTVCFPGIFQPKAAVSRIDPLASWVFPPTTLLSRKGLLPVKLLLSLLSQLFFSCFPKQSYPSPLTSSFCVGSSPGWKSLQGNTQRQNITVDFEEAIGLWSNQSFCKWDVFHYFVFYEADGFIQAFTC